VFSLVKGEHIFSARDLPILGYRKNGKPIYPIMGGSEPPKQDDPPKNDQPKNDPPKGPVEATDEETGIGLGFPKETKVEDMKPEQQAAYWRHQSKVQQKKVPANLSELQAAKAELDQIKLKQQTPAEQQLQQVRDETAAATRKEVAAESALTNLRIVLHTRGKSDAEVDGLVEFINPERFLTQDGKVDTAKVMSYADGIAPAGSGGGGRPGGLPGQGRYDQSAQDKAAAGKEEADRRWKTQPPSGKSALLPSNT
jgi:hypothetical protein